MSDPRYTFICEIEHFDVDDYVAHLGWNSRKVNYLKIYTQPGSLLFYLHDETQDRMYAFKVADPDKLNSMEEFECVVRLFKNRQQD